MSSDYILETRGLTALVTGVDAMLKSANVSLVGPMKQVGNALVSAVVTLLKRLAFWP